MPIKHAINYYELLLPGPILYRFLFTLFSQTQISGLYLKGADNNKFH